MSNVEINIDLPSHLDEKIRELADWQKTSWSEICVKAIKSAYFVMLQRDAERTFYQDGIRLTLPEPQESQHAPMNIMRMFMSATLQDSFNKTCKALSLQPHSVIEWGVDCSIILQDAVLLHQNVYATRPGQKIPTPVPKDISY